MSEISQTTKGRLSTRIDMTPMVDLGFLLITFFMLTTTLQKPSQIQLNMPKDEKKTSQIPASKTLALITGPNNKVYFYRGDLNDPNTNIGVTDYTNAGLRNIIMENKQQVEMMHKGKENFVIVLMPLDKSTYKNVIDVLDEFTITNSERYGIIEPNKLVINKLKSKGLLME